MISPDERIKELKKQGYISGVMAGKWYFTLVLQ